MKVLGNKISTDLYIKSTDRYQYLRHTSSQPGHTKKSIVYSYALLKLSRICSEKKDFQKNICEMKSWFSQRGYPPELIKTETSKVRFSTQTVFHKAKVDKGVPLVVTCHPLLIVRLSTSKNICVICFIESPFKNNEKCFLFHLKSSFCSQGI